MAIEKFWKLNLIDFMTIFVTTTYSGVKKLGEVNRIGILKIKSLMGSSRAMVKGMQPSSDRTSQV